MKSFQLLFKIILNKFQYILFINIIYFIFIYYHIISNIIYSLNFHSWKCISPPTQHKVNAFFGPITAASLGNTTKCMLYTEGATGRHTDRQTEGHTDRQKDRETDGATAGNMWKRKRNSCSASLRSAAITIMTDRQTYVLSRRKSQWTQSVQQSRVYNFSTYSKDKSDRRGERREEKINIIRRKRKM